MFKIDDQKHKIFQDWGLTHTTNAPTVGTPLRKLKPGAGACIQCRFVDTRANIVFWNRWYGSSHWDPGS
jgi:hypothetical protein